MKKTVRKKLVLAKETLVDLQDGLGYVAAAATVVGGGCATYTCENSNGARTCVTCGGTCTSNLC